MDVVCVGIMVADVLVKSVDKIPESGLLSQVDSIEIFTGGNAMTAALNLKKMGVNSGVVGEIGKDSFGDMLYGAMENSEINTDGVLRNSEVQTSTSIVLSATDGERTFLHCLGANATFSIEKVNKDIFKDAKLVFVTGSFLLDAFDGKQTADFLKECKQKDKITVLDCCWDSKDRWGDLLNESLKYVDYFIPSKEEALAIAKTDSVEEASDVFFDRGVGCVVIKLGKDGCFVRGNKDMRGDMISSVNVNVVDTTGAGDSFCSGFIAALLKGNNIHDCVRFANTVGSLCVSARGATTGILTYDETKEETIKNYGGDII